VLSHHNEHLDHPLSIVYSSVKDVLHPPLMFLRLPKCPPRLPIGWRGRALTTPPLPAPSLRKMPVYYHPDYTLPLDSHHTFPMERYDLVHTAVQKAAQVYPLHVQSPVPCTKEQVLLVHDAEYVSRFNFGHLDRLAVRTIGFPWSYELVRRTYRITGATVQCVHDVLQSDGQVPIAGNLAGGTHHAFKGHGEGYCIFNDVAVAARVAQQDYHVGRCLVIDLDVHQGNGTAEIFTNDSSVFTWSVHGDSNYPWKSRVPSDLDTALPDDVTGDDYLQEVERGLGSINPLDFDLIFYQAGVDPLSYDRLGRLRLTREDLQARNALVYSWCDAHDKKCVVTMGGGYAKPIEQSVACHVDVFTQAANMMARH
jgi:acetoin utilization deacetylase AcuC-like enzyme